MARTLPAEVVAEQQGVLGARLRTLRRHRRLGSVEVARRVGKTQTTITRVELGQISPDPDLVRALCDIYDAAESERAELIRLAEAVRVESKRSRIVLPRGASQLQRTWQEMDRNSTLRRTYSPTIVPGILQTAGYIRIIFDGAIGDEDMDEVVAGRLARRATLGKDAAQQHVIVVTEGALRWQLGSAGLMVEQVEVIAEASRVPNLRLGVIPWTRPVRFTCTHTFNLYDDAAVVVGTEVSSAVFTDPDDVQLYVDLFRQAEAAAVFGDDARRELARVAADYRMLA